MVSMIWMITRGFLAQVAPRFTRASVCVVVMVLAAGLHGLSMRRNKSKRANLADGAAGGGTVEVNSSSPSNSSGGGVWGGGVGVGTGESVARLTQREHFTLLVATCFVSAVVVCWICSWADITARVKVRSIVCILRFRLWCCPLLDTRYSTPRCPYLGTRCLTTPIVAKPGSVPQYGHDHASDFCVVPFRLDRLW